MKNTLVWEEALKLLQEGNERFVNQTIENHYNDKRLLDSFHNGQAPHTIMLSCSDSRVSPDIIFDVHLGSIFVVNNAGNIVDDTVIGSIQFAVENLGTKLVVVLGHSNCGAVTAASDNVVVQGKLNTILDRIKPHLHENESLEHQCINNTKAMAQLLRNEPLVNIEGVEILPAFYNIEKGSVDFEI